MTANLYHVQNHFVVQLIHTLQISNYVVASVHSTKGFNPYHALHTFIYLCELHDIEFIFQWSAQNVTKYS